MVLFALLTSSKVPPPPAIHTAVCSQGPKHTPYPFMLCDTVQNKVPFQLPWMPVQQLERIAVDTDSLKLVDGCGWPATLLKENIVSSNMLMSLSLNHTMCFQLKKNH